MANTPRRYLFDHSFDDPQGPVALQFTRQPPEPTFSKAELEIARVQAAEEARATALAEAAASIEGRLADATDALAAGITSVLERDEAIRAQVELQALELLRAVLTRALPVLARRDPLVEIEGMVVECLREAFDEPRIVLRIPEPLFDAMRQRLGVLAQQSGFAGKFVLLVDETLGPVDCRLEWADGGAERDLNRLQRDIDGTLARALQPQAAVPTVKEPDHE